MCVCVCVHSNSRVFLSVVSDSDFPMMLSVFSNLLSKEDDRRVIDNLCAALCRMITSNVEVIPLEQVRCAILPARPSQCSNRESVLPLLNFRFCLRL